MISLSREEMKGKDHFDALEQVTPRDSATRDSAKH